MLGENDRDLKIALTMSTVLDREQLLMRWDLMANILLACRTGVIFLRILGEQRRKWGEREAYEYGSRSPRFRLCSPKIRKKVTPVLQTNILRDNAKPRCIETIVCSLSRNIK